MYKRIIAGTLLAFTAVGFAVCSGDVFAQQIAPPGAVQSEAAAAGLSGIVLDLQGRSISGADVVLEASGKTIVVKTKTDASGRFSFAAVVSGSYKVAVSANGFADSARSVEIAPNASAELDFNLDVASVQSTVTVSGDRASLVQTETTSGSLGPLSIMDLPQSVQVANRELLDEQKVYQYTDAISYLPGVQRAYTTIEGSIGNEVALRGFNLDYNNNYLRDGLKWCALGLSDTADIESVEVLKGPASALYGTAEAGGIVNIISKKPTETPYTSVSMNGGSYQYLRPDFDFSGPINPAKSLFYRVNGVYENTESFRQYIDSVKYLIAPYFLWKPSASTSLAVQAEVINANRTSDYGTVLLGDRPAPVPVSTNYAEPWNTESDRDRQLGYRFNHLLKSGWTVTNAFQLARTNSRYLEVYTTGPDTDPTQLTRLADTFYFPTLYRFSQTNLLGMVKTGPLTHHVAMGFEAGWVTQSSEGPAAMAPNVSILNPVIGSDFTKEQAYAALQDPLFSLTYKTVIHNQAGYVQDQIDMGKHWKAIAGVRVENYYQDSIDTSGSTPDQKQNDLPVSPRVGVVYEPSHMVTVYGSYVRSFIPTSPSAINSAGKQFTPENDHQWETGVKIAPASGRVIATLALFQIQKNDVLATDPSNPIFSIQNGEERSKGVEVELTGSPVRGLNLLTSYAFVQAQVTKSTVYPVDNLLPNAARNSGAIWANYQAPYGLLQHVGLSAGMLATSARQDNFYNTALLPGYARVDLGTYYLLGVGERKTVKFSLNIQNAFDRTYYLASNGTDQIRPGSPISVLAGVSWTWR